VVRRRSDGATERRGDGGRGHSPPFAPIPESPSLRRLVPSSLRRSHGFILVDVIVAGILLGIGLAVVIGLTGSAIASQRRGEELQTAAMLADEQLNLVLAVGPEEFPSVFETKGACAPPFEEYSYEVRLTPGEGVVPYRVQAEILWKSAGHDRSLMIETLVSVRRGDEPDPERAPEQVIERGAE
jgi:hypothetical protein